MGDASESRSDVLQELNRRIVELAREALRLGRDEPLRWTLFCECGDPACGRPVELSLDEYEALRASDLPVLARHGAASG